MARPESEIDLAEGALLIACEEYGDLPVPVYLSRLDGMAEELRARLPERAAAQAAAHVLGEYLFREKGFHGNTEAYYDPRNSFLNDVLDRRTGIPITLSALYMEVARRAGVRVQGVGLPGHFLVKLPTGKGAILVDPFHGGVVLSSSDCQERLDRIFAGRLRIEPRMLQAVGPKQILARVLRNLKAIYLKQEDHSRALGVLELLLRVSPGSPEDLRDRGLVLAALDCYGLAIRDLESYLDRAGPARDNAELRATVQALQAKAARVH
jgi:regulator of sirC expression with transglutaminase-like and TPR domain